MGTERTKPHHQKAQVHKHQINTIAEEDRSDGESDRKGTERKQGRAKRKANLQMATQEDREHTFVSNPSGDEELLEQVEQQQVRV